MARKLRSKARFGRWLIIALAVVLAFGSAGVAYARMQGGPPNRGVVATSSCCCGPFTWVVSNDDGIEDTVDPYGVIDPGDDGGGTNYDRWGDQSSDDPSEPQVAGQPCARYDKDVARTTASISEENDEITVLVENGYPCYYSTVFFGLKCPESALGTVTGIVIDNPYPEALTVTTSGIYVGQTLPQDEEVVGAVHVHIEQPAAQNAVYTFKVSITIECSHCQWEDETAWADGPEYRRPSFEMYTPYVPDSTVDLLATSQKLKAGTVHFSTAVDGKVTITITLDPGWRFRQDVENVKIQDYAQAPPYGTNPVPGTFDYRFTATASPFSALVQENNYYGVHADLDRLDCG